MGLFICMQLKLEFTVKWAYLFAWNNGPVCSHGIEINKNPLMDGALFVYVELEYIDN